MDNYTAACAKVQAMRAKLAEGRPASPDGLMEDFMRISSYLHEKPARDFVKCMAVSLTAGLNASNSDAVSYWAYILWHRLGTLDKRNQAGLKRILGMEIDLQNILILYRLKRYYQLDGDGVFGFLVPAGYRLNRRDIRRMAASKDVSAFIDAAAETPYSNVFGDLADFRLGRQRLARAVRERFRREKTGIAKICGYLYEKHLEIRNTIIMAQGARLGIKQEEILERLY